MVGKNISHMKTDDFMITYYFQSLTAWLVKTVSHMKTDDFMITYYFQSPTSWLVKAISLMKTDYFFDNILYPIITL